MAHRATHFICGWVLSQQKRVHFCKICAEPASQPKPDLRININSMTECPQIITASQCAFYIPNMYAFMVILYIYIYIADVDI